MACDPSTLINQVSAFAGMGQEELDLVSIALLKRWLLAINPGADVTPEGLLASVSAFSSMNRMDLELIAISLLCDISQP